ncbi:AfsR/SARP family transcriptional regulator [Solihabitans fulvus]|uniref:AfsR/SARP family transcriptional regulator n=1 Tax=Solihabitans fulvus TaxID=1892852 RepID=A0A5B2WZ44_9PSEU|nr:BTAD domain-containing putative transcriptional regulator [Solihabitans fulvus]KAA2256328.1 AfsR/SARP family transcriptional regulator [Solihabitans fulvus]
MRFRVLGQLTVLGTDGAAVALPGARARDVLAMLLTARPGAVTRQRLLDELWADGRARDPVNALHVQIAKLRAALPSADADRLVTEPSGYRLVTRHGEVDADEFAALAERGRGLLADRRLAEARETLLAALALWRGPALADIGDHPFARPERGRLDELRLAAAEDAAEAGLAVGVPAAVTPELTALLAEHPLRERAAGLLMLALSRSGRQADALAVFADVRGRLADQLGVDPSPALRARHAEVLRQDGAAPPSPPKRVAAPAVGTLPIPLGAFVGRDAELSSLTELLGRHRLVTLVGPGGGGKTRTAVQVGHRARRSHSDGVWLVELAAITRAGSVAEAVLAALAPAEGELGVAPAGAPLDRLVDLLRDRDLLLLLDNCEHVVDDTAGVVAALLRSCPRLTVLATSREPLAIDGERLAPLPPLSLDAAVELFRTCAAMLAPDLPSGPEADAAIRRVCARLDGLPLAVELAAARTKMMSVEDIESRLDDWLRLPGNPSRDVPARHHTLRAVLDWSFELLPAAERRAFESLAVFAGGCTLADAERVCADEELSGAEVVDVLGRLVDKSLLVPVRDPAGGRFRMLDTVLEYAGCALAASARGDEVRDRHAEAMLALAEAAYEDLPSPRQRDWLTRLGAELPNIRAATTWLLERGDTVSAMLLNGWLGYFWYVSGRETEGTTWLLRVLDAHDRAPGTDEGDLADKAVCGALGWLVWLGLSTGLVDDPWQLAERLTALGGRTDDVVVAADLRAAVANLRGLALRRAGRAEEAAAQFDAAWLTERARPIRAEVAAANLALLAADQGEETVARQWVSRAVDGVDQVVDPLARDGLAAFVHAEPGRGREVLRPLAERLGQCPPHIASPLAALC